MMNGLSATANSNDVKYPPNVANSRGLSAAELDVDKLYEPKQNKKIVRIFTVILYMFSVSLGAILLSLYYVFLWKNPHTQAINMRTDNISTNTMILEPTLSSDFMDLEDQYEPDQVTQGGERMVRDDLRMLEVGVTAFPKASRGIPPVASRYVDKREAVGDDGTSPQSAAHQPFVKKRSLLYKEDRNSITNR